MTLKKKLRIAILASGGGTNLQSIIDLSQKGLLDAHICLVLSNNPEAGALQRAQRAGINTACIDHRVFASREEFDQTVVTTLKDAGAELIVLAGFMRIISEIFLDAFPQRIINIHPALLPSFPGLHVQRKAIEYGAKFTGCTVHFVDSGVDTGPIIAQAVVPICPDDSEETLAARILQQEHQIYPQAIQWIAEGRVRIEGRRVYIDKSRCATSALINPALNK
ncbi:formyltetrahydrofolate-dependent phosphoribosylglycinamide formyltransferase [Desulfuromusa kysingii]|uniref:Phosphoribosylglycinamide formyltransferase n=1 Tax=Desulfuromusa kysingii TaxID=37625 RepID=A0A1H4CZ30_9BACT|nr:phosphoribosylglycinamide formyltransferase [Desulfuromusa kysingii]SEA65568.1 formyltetrahydrofolate-dependent phosphoribosylglycinamide formyltransferase [Desulfuromusa kysingii]